MQILRKVLITLGLGLFLFVPAQAGFLKASVNLGGGYMWSDSIRHRFAAKSGVSFHASIHIQPPGPFILAPFYDVSFSSPVFNMLGGSLLYTVEMRDFKTHILFVGPSIGVVASDGVSQRFIGGEVGYKFPIGEKMGLIGRIKYLQDNNDVVDGFSGHIGITFKLVE